MKFVRANQVPPPARENGHRIVVFSRPNFLILILSKSRSKYTTPVISQLVEHLTVELRRHQMVLDSGQPDFHL